MAHAAAQSLPPFDLAESDTSPQLGAIRFDSDCPQPDGEKDVPPYHGRIGPGDPRAGLSHGKNPVQLFEVDASFGESPHQIQLFGVLGSDFGYIFVDNAVELSRGVILGA